jgi:hypothetical protein
MDLMTFRIAPGSCDSYLNHLSFLSELVHQLVLPGANILKSYFNIIL